MAIPISPSASAEEGATDSLSKEDGAYANPESDALGAGCEGAKGEILIDASFGGLEKDTLGEPI
ncbi:MAG: hypothetical protein JW986_01110 [Methanotrichaceae archaeon]|nr:hypothetical protein [Methanotrichaceae archaeon]